MNDKEIIENNIQEEDFKEIFSNIKDEILNAQYDIFQNANARTLSMYYTIGKIINDNAKWGNKFINHLSVRLKIEFPNMKGFSITNLKYMRTYYLECQQDENLKELSAKIPWSHNILILSKIKDKEQRQWYMEQTELNGWAYDVLGFEIKSDLYTRQVLGDKPNNFKRTLKSPQSELAKAMMKDPYILDLSNLKESYIETELEKAMVERIKTVLLELGNGFSFVGNQYRLEVDGDEYFIDLLFYHTKLHCYIVVELKNTAYKPEYAGKLNFYLSAVDDLVKTEYDNPSIGII
jgi:predicted nuclease of restriction endonuclease-like (RecB) superfamily